MGKSGNPAKRQAFAGEEEAVKGVRAGIKAGKAVTIPLTDKTRITINSTDPDEAEFITRIIINNQRMSEEQNVRDLLNGFNTYFMYLGLDDEKLNQRIIKALEKQLKKQREYSEWNNMVGPPAMSHEEGKEHREGRCSHE